MSVTTWRARFRAHRLEGLVDLPQSGAPRAVADSAIEGMVTLTLEGQPENATRSSTWAMARRVDMSQGMVSRVWRAFGLQHSYRTVRVHAFKLSAGVFARGAGSDVLRDTGLDPARGTFSAMSGAGLSQFRPPVEWTAPGFPEASWLGLR